MKALFLMAIRFYGRFISPMLGRNCRFHPTCSQYTYQAIEEHGAAKGLWLGLKRIGKCHPYYEGDMLDPPPRKRAVSKAD